MAREVVWSNEAFSDLELISNYIAKDSKFYAASFAQEILVASKSLHELSKRGRIVPELSNQNIRELFVKEYRLIYLIKKENVVILTIIHGKRNLKIIKNKK